MVETERIQSNAVNHKERLKFYGRDKAPRCSIHVRTDPKRNPKRNPIAKNVEVVVPNEQQMSNKWHHYDPVPRFERFQSSTWTSPTNEAVTYRCSAQCSWHDVQDTMSSTRFRTMYRAQCTGQTMFRAILDQQVGSIQIVSYNRSQIIWLRWFQNRSG